MDEFLTRERSSTRSQSMIIDGPLPDAFSIFSEFVNGNLDSQSQRVLAELKKISDFQKESIQEVIEKTQSLVSDIIWQRDQLILKIKEECSTRALELKNIILGFQNVDMTRRSSRILKPSYNMPLLEFKREIAISKHNWIKKNQVSIRYSENGIEKIQGLKGFAPLLSPMYLEINEAGTVTQLLLNRKLGDDGSRQLSHILPYYTNLTSLIMAQNYIGPRGGKFIGSSLSYLRKLNKLSINNDRIKEGIVSIVRVLPMIPYLSEVYLSTGMFHEREAGDIGNALSLMQNLKKLSLLGGVLETKGTERICYGLFFLVNLKQLDLSGNSLGPGGTEILCMTLMNLNELECLKLSANGMGSQGGEKIGGLIAKMENLKELWLNSNALGDQGACELMNQGGSNLQTLKLQDNSIGNIGAKVVLQKGAEWGKLYIIDLSWNSIDDSISGVFKGNEEKYRHFELDFCGMKLNEKLLNSFGFPINV